MKNLIFKCSIYANGNLQNLHITDNLFTMHDCIYTTLCSRLLSKLYGKVSVFLNEAKFKDGNLQAKNSVFNSKKVVLNQFTEIEIHSEMNINELYKICIDKFYKDNLKFESKKSL